VRTGSLQAGTLVAALALLTGCGSATHIYVKSTAATNDGNTLYVAVREVDSRPGSVNQPYQQAAAELFTDPPNPRILVTQPVFPGDSTTVSLDKVDKDVVVSFFFTDPGGNWRIPLRHPLPAAVYIDLGQHQIERWQVK
jgi:hypothetical protein